MKTTHLSCALLMLFVISFTVVAGDRVIPRPTPPEGDGPAGGFPLPAPAQTSNNTSRRSSPNQEPSGVRDTPPPRGGTSVTAKSAPTPRVAPTRQILQTDLGHETEQVADVNHNNSWTPGAFTVILIFGFLSLNLAIAVFLFGVIRKISSEIRNSKASSNSKLGLSGDSADLLKEDLARFGKRISAIEKDQATITQKLKEISVTVQSIKGRVNDAKAGEQLERLQNIREESITTKSVESILVSSSTSSVYAKRDNLTGALVSCEQSEASFVILSGPGFDNVSEKAIPRMTRFSSASAYHDFYAKFFLCKNPGAGEVWVKEPCLLRRDKSGWAMIKQGELEIR